MIRGSPNGFSRTGHNSWSLLFLKVYKLWQWQTWADAVEQYSDIRCESFWIWGHFIAQKTYKHNKIISANLGAYMRTCTTKTRFTYFWGEKENAAKKKALQRDTHDPPQKNFFNVYLLKRSKKSQP